jgi:hypothetical protein
MTDGQAGSDDKSAGEGQPPGGGGQPPAGGGQPPAGGGKPPGGGGKPPGGGGKPPEGAGKPPGGGGKPPASEKQHYSAEDADVAKTASYNQADVEKRRARMGLFAVLASDVAIAVAAILGVVIIRNDSASSTAVVSVLSSAFTAIGTLTTAYFGIKASANTAKNSIANQQDSSPGPSN